MLTTMARTRDGMRAVAQASAETINRRIRARTFRRQSETLSDKPKPQHQALTAFMKNIH